MDVLGLSKEVGEEDLVVLSARDGVEGLNGSEEITAGQREACSLVNHVPWDELGTLVNELVKGMLTVGTALSPDDGLKRQSTSRYMGMITHSSLVVDSGSILGNALSVGLHVSLLEVIGKLLHVLVVR
jgi:hypothetical protein